MHRPIAQGCHGRPGQAEACGASGGYQAGPRGGDTPNGAGERRHLRWPLLTHWQRSREMRKIKCRTRPARMPVFSEQPFLIEEALGRRDLSRGRPDSGPCPCIELTTNHTIGSLLANKHALRARCRAARTSSDSSFHLQGSRDSAPVHGSEKSRLRRRRFGWRNGCTSRS